MTVSKYKVCILAAGPSRRVGDYSENVHKAVLPVGGKGVISHIVEKFPEDVEIVVAVGHRKDTVIDYLRLAYPLRRFTFVEIERYIGPGTGPGRSLLECKDHLRCPFVLCTADTIVSEQIGDPYDNWFGVAPTTEPEKYCTVSIDAGRVTQLKDKEKCDNTQAFIGLAGVRDWEKFFVALETDDSARAGEIQVSNGFRALVGDLRARSFSWFDTGDVDGFKRANQHFADGSEAFDFSKTDEYLYFVNGKVIKFFADLSIAQNRIKRANVLAGMCPKLVGTSGHFYAYDKVPGKVLYDALDVGISKDFFAWCGEKLWQPKKLEGEALTQFKNACVKFYKEKTLQRVHTFFTKTGTVDVENIVNGERVPTLKSLMAKVDWEWICEGAPAPFHGDLQFDNVLLNEGDAKRSFTLLDWRQDFAGLLDHGDLYYDLAKVYGGLILSYKGIKQNKFTCEVRQGDVKFDFHAPEALADIRAAYEKFLTERGFDLHKVQVLTALIFLNMSPLHHAPFDVLLFHLARSMLKKTLGTTGPRKVIAAKAPPLLCIGPMSKEIVDTVIDFSFQHGIPMSLIASRSQVETQALGGGYANNWCTEDFAAYVRAKLKETPADVLICRDHGGPWLGADEKTLAEKHAMLAAKASFEADIAAGFNQLHIDTSVNPGGFDMEASLRRAFELISFCEEKARQYGTKLNYEIGTEDADGGIVDPEQFEHFLSRIVAFCEERKINKPRFIVGRTGSWVREMYQVGAFDPENTRSLLAISNRYGVGIKEHNADYDSAENHHQRARVGVTAINVAPEFGILQTKVVLEHCRRKGRADLYEKFLDLAYASKKWKKWLRTPDLTTREEKAIIAGHYVFGTAAFKAIATELGPELDEEIRRAVRHKLDWYARHLGLYQGAESLYEDATPVMAVA
jgi:dTDP-glucose pyrophosphorylase